jgi:hypothetical protein
MDSLVRRDQAVLLREFGRGIPQGEDLHGLDPTEWFS